MCRDPRVAISISDIHGFNQGKVIEQISEDTDEHTDRLAKKYLGMDKYPYCFQMKKSHFKK